MSDRRSSRFNKSGISPLDDRSRSSANLNQLINASNQPTSTLGSLTSSSSASSTRPEAKLAAIFAFDPSLGGEQNEHDKVLAFYPNDTSIEQQNTSVGLSEAFANFTS
jgi:hypothetical protein